jgi:uncharacterized membrane protein
MLVGQVPCMGVRGMIFRSEGERRNLNRQRTVTLILAVFLIALYFLNIIPRTSTDIKINNLWVFFFPIQIMMTLYSVWRYTRKSENLLFLQFALLLLSWLTQFSSTLDYTPHLMNSYILYDLSTTFEAALGVSVEELLYAIFSLTAIGLAVWPLLKRKLHKKPILASIP